MRGERRRYEQQLEQAQRERGVLRTLVLSGEDDRDSSAAAASTIGTTGTLKTSAAPAIPINSVTSAARLVTSMVPSETHAQPRP